MLMFSDLLASRGLLRMLVRRELETRYAGSVLGIFWNYLGPILQVLLYVIIFSQIMLTRGAGGEDFGKYYYLVHLTVGIVPWLYFAEVLSRSSSTLLDNATILKKTPINPELLFVGGFIVSTAIHGGAFVALLVFFAILGVPLDATLIFAFPVFLLFGLVALGLGMILSVLNVLVRDVGPIVGIGLMVGFWTLPIVYTESILPEWYRDLLPLHPLHGYVGFMQFLFTKGADYWNPAWLHLMIFLPLFLLLSGRLVLAKQRTEVIDSL